MKTRAKQLLGYLLLDIAAPANLENTCHGQTLELT